MLHWSRCKWEVVDAVLEGKKYIGFTTSSFGSSARRCTEFCIFSNENKTLQKFNSQDLFPIDNKTFQKNYNVEGPHIIVCKDKNLLYCSTIDSWMLIGMDEKVSIWVPRLYHLELNVSMKTFSLVFLTECSFSEAIGLPGSTVVFGNEVYSISWEMDSMYVCDLSKNSWSARQQLVNGTVHEFIEKRYLPYCDSGG